MTNTVEKVQSANMVEAAFKILFTAVSLGNEREAFISDERTKIETDFIILMSRMGASAEDIAINQYDLDEDGGCTEGIECIENIIAEGFKTDIYIQENAENADAEVKITMINPDGITEIDLQAALDAGLDITEQNEWFEGNKDNWYSVKDDMFNDGVVFGESTKIKVTLGLNHKTKLHISANYDC